jgi:tetratricopeptide (TPR) repeat protein
MKVSDLLKKATKLKKENKVEEAIKVLDEAYEKGIYQPSSFEMKEDQKYTDLDNTLSLQDLVRKAKYLQEIGKIDESLKYLDDLIKPTSGRANYSIWEIDDLSSLHNHKAIVLKKEKRFNEEFIERLKSYSLEGISANLKSANKDISFSKSFVPILKHYLDPVKLLKFIEDNSKKTTIKFDKREVVRFVQLVINQQYKTDRIGIEFKKLVKD